MGVSKVEFGGETIVDLTGDTVNPNVLLKGETAHGADGEMVEGAVVAVPTTTSLAVTEEGVSALDGAVGKVLNDKFGGCTFEQVGNDFYITGADAVRKKLGDSASKKYKITGRLSVTLNTSVGENPSDSKTISFIHAESSISNSSFPEASSYSIKAACGCKAVLSNIVVTEVK